VRNRLERLSNDEDEGDVRDDVRSDEEEPREPHEGAEAGVRKELEAREEPRGRTALDEAFDDDEVAREEEEDRSVDAPPDLLRRQLSPQGEKERAASGRGPREIGSDRVSDGRCDDDEEDERRPGVEHAHAFARDERAAQFSSKEKVEDRVVERERSDGHRRSVKEIVAILEPPKRRAEHVLRIPDERRRASRVRSGGQRQEVGKRRQRLLADELDDERRSENADGVVRDERGEDPRSPDDHAEKPPSRAGSSPEGDNGSLEETIDGEEGPHAHHAEE